MIIKLRLLILGFFCCFTLQCALTKQSDVVSGVSEPSVKLGQKVNPSDWRCLKKAIVGSNNIIYLKHFETSNYGVVVNSSGEVFDINITSGKSVKKGKINVSDEELIQQVYFSSPDRGLAAISINKNNEEGMFTRSILYSTKDGGESWKSIFDRNGIQIVSIFQDDFNIFITGRQDRISERKSTHDPTQTLLLSRSNINDISWTDLSNLIHVKYGFGVALTHNKKGIFLLTSSRAIFNLSASDMMQFTNVDEKDSQLFYRFIHSPSETDVPRLIGSTNSREGVWSKLIDHANGERQEKDFTKVYFMSAISLNENNLYLISGYSVNDSSIPLEQRKKSGGIYFVPKSDSSIKRICEDILLSTETMVFTDQMQNVWMTSANSVYIVESVKY